MGGVVREGGAPSPMSRTRALFPAAGGPNTMGAKCSRVSVPAADMCGTCKKLFSAMSAAVSTAMVIAVWTNTRSS